MIHAHNQAYAHNIVTAREHRTTATVWPGTHSLATAGRANRMVCIRNLRIIICVNADATAPTLVYSLRSEVRWTPGGVNKAFISRLGNILTLDFVYRGRSQRY